MKVLEQIKNFIQLHTSDMGNREYIDLMQTLSEWSANQADLTEYREENENDYRDKEE